MSIRQRPGLMRRVGFVTVLLALAVAMLPAVAGAGEPESPATGVCRIAEGQYKYDVDEGRWEPSDPGVVLDIVLDEDGEADRITVPEGWIIVCAKAGEELAYPNEPTVDMEKAISHIVIEAVEGPEIYNGSFVKQWVGDELPDGVTVTFTVRFGDDDPFVVESGELIEYPVGEFPYWSRRTSPGYPIVAITKQLLVIRWKSGTTSSR